MQESEMTTEDLLRELSRLKGRVAELEAAAASKDLSSEDSDSSFVRRQIIRRESDRELERQRQTLERVVTERTRELEDANRRLQDEISERQKVEAALRKSEERFRRLAENAPDIIYRYEFIPERRFTYVSPGVRGITGRSPEEYYADPDLPFKLVHPDDRGLLEAIFRKGPVDEGLPAVCLPDVRWVSEEGVVIWTEEHTAPIHDETGRLVAIEGIVRNITERKHAEEALRKLNQTLLGIIEFLPDATFVIDQDRKVIAWNRAIEVMTGVTKEEILGKGGHAYSIPFYGDKRPMLIDMVFDDEVAFPHEYDFIRKKRSTLYAEAHVPETYLGEGAYLWIMASPLYDERGRRIGAIESIRDITEHKLMEEELRSSAEKIKLFAYSVSHDLKSPIIGINGLSRLLMRQCWSDLDEKGQRYCEQMQRTCEQVVALVEELNAYIKAKEVPLHFDAFDPAEVINAVRGEFDALLSVRRIKWVGSDRLPPFIRADRMSLLRVLRNFVDNALKYGGPTLSEIRLGYEDSQDYHIFSVADDGIGIGNADAEKLFDLFQRNETSRGVEGSGLGLAIVKEIAKKHQGKVFVTPGREKGVAFSCCLAKNL